MERNKERESRVQQVIAHVHWSYSDGKPILDGIAIVGTLGELVTDFGESNTNEKGVKNETRKYKNLAS